MEPKDKLSSTALRFAYDRYIGNDRAKAEALDAELAEAGAPSCLNRVMDGVARCLTPEAAERLSAFRIDPTAQARIDYLAGQSNEGLLTDEERTEYETLVVFFDFLALLKAKARRHVANRS